MAKKSIHLEREQRSAFAELLMEEMSYQELATALERWELICEQRGWPHGAEDSAPAGTDAAQIEAALERATEAAREVQDDDEAGESWKSVG